MGTTDLDRGGHQKRRVYFSVVVWGERFRRYLVDFMLRSLLAPGNLPCEGPIEKILLIYCPEADWRALDTSEIFSKVRQHAEIEWAEFNPDVRYPVPSMTKAHALSFQRAFERNAILCFLAPDVVYSDQFVVSLTKWISEGHRLVVCPALRADENLFLSSLDSILDGRIPEVIAIPAEQMNGITVRSLHSEIRTANLARPFLDSFPNNFHLQADDASWFVGRNLSWTPILIDLDGKPSSGADIVEKSIIDGHALAEIFSADEDILYVTDSQTVAQGTWGPTDWNAKPLHRQWTQCVPGLKAVFNDAVIRSTVKRYVSGGNGEFYDWIKVRGLRQSVVLGDSENHKEDVAQAEQSLQDYIDRACGDIVFDAKTTPYQKLLDSCRGMLALYAAYLHKKRIAKSYGDVLTDAFFGRGDARARVRRRFHKVIGSSR